MKEVRKIETEHVRGLQTYQAGSKIPISKRYQQNSNQLVPS